MVEFGRLRRVVKGDRSSLSLAGDAWSAAAPGGVAGERESEAEKETRECESEG